MARLLLRLSRIWRDLADLVRKMKFDAKERFGNASDIMGQLSRSELDEIRCPSHTANDLHVVLGRKHRHDFGLEKPGFL